ncbi:MAG: DUF815 domain-containing protein [Gemmatimonadetes bacterium]|nr:DUF815 domain-containing protein [Gemmatimonadota bacterium]
MTRSEETLQIAGQVEAMLTALDRFSSFSRLLEPDEIKQLRSLLRCAQACADRLAAGKEAQRTADELAVQHQRCSEALLAAALNGDWGGGAPDLQGLLLNRLFNGRHSFLRACEEQAPADVPAALRQVACRDLQSASVLARPSWGIWLRLIGRDAEPLTFMPGDGVEPEAVGQLKERFARSEDWAELAGALGCLIHEYGRGALRRLPAFRLVDRGAKPSLEPIRHFAEFPLGWLEGNEARIQVLEENTRYFLTGYPAHNALIWGPRGGGKSTLIRALVGKFFDRGLRAIEISPSCYHLLPDLFTLVRGRRQRFVGVLDNVSLGRGDDSLHLLSRTLDGGLEACPDNLIFYATSNYKDLVDREGERPQGLGQMQLDDERPNRVNQGIQAEFYDPQQLQRLDQERALDDRFALKVFLGLPSRQQYRAIVLSYARRAEIDLPEEDLLAAFEVWRMRHNHDLVGGRTARDFIDAYLPQYLRDKGESNQSSSNSIS